MGNVILTGLWTKNIPKETLEAMMSGCSDAIDRLRTSGESIYSLGVEFSWENGIPNHLLTVGIENPVTGNQHHFKERLFGKEWGQDATAAEIADMLCADTCLTQFLAKHLEQ